MGYKRINITVDEDLLARVQQAGVSNFSGTIRHALEAQLDPNSLILNLSPELRKKYEDVIEITGADDTEVLQYFDQAISQLLKDKQQSVLEKMSQYLPAQEVGGQFEEESKPPKSSKKDKKKKGKKDKKKRHIWED